MNDYKILFVPSRGVLINGRGRLQMPPGSCNLSWRFLQTFELREVLPFHVSDVSHVLCYSILVVAHRE
jgi:hypothetical protein